MKGSHGSELVYLVFMLKPNNGLDSFTGTMSRSTTGTSSYILSKYSRSYPLAAKPKRTQIQTQTQPGLETTSEWQHFTNPVIRLVLDVKTSSSTEIESVRLRIMWHINSDIENDSNNSVVVFASLSGFINSLLALF